MKSARHENFSLWVTLTILASSLLLAACKPTNLPGIREIAEQWDKKAEQYTEELIGESPVFQELNHLCTEEIPLFEGFKFVSRNAIQNPKRKFLTYFYFSEAKHHEVKMFYLDYFTKSEWQIIEQEDSGWGSIKLEVKRNNYRVILFHKGLGDKANYAFHCEKIFESANAE